MKQSDNSQKSQTENEIIEGDIKITSDELSVKINNEKKTDISIKIRIDSLSMDSNSDHSQVFLPENKIMNEEVVKSHDEFPLTRNNEKKTDDSIKRRIDSLSMDSNSESFTISRETSMKVIKQLQNNINELKETSKRVHLHRFQKRRDLHNKINMIIEEQYKSFECIERMSKKNYGTKQESYDACKILDTTMSNRNLNTDENNGEEKQEIEQYRQKRKSFHDQSSFGREQLQKSKSEMKNSFGIASNETLNETGLFNTRTIHMHAILVAYQYTLDPTPKKQAWSWMMSFVSFFTIFLQIYITYPLYLGIFLHPCTMHDDCGRGMQCDVTSMQLDFRQPRCGDCSRIDWDEHCPFNLKDESWTVEQLTEKVWFDVDFSPKTSLDLDPFDIDVFKVCSSKEYCEDTYQSGMEDTICDQNKIYKTKYTAAAKVCMVFVCLLFATSLSTDLKEADTENQLLDFVLNQAPEKSSVHFAYIIRISNRIRRFYLPFVTTLGGAAIMLSEELTSRNILLNLVTILFLLEADNTLATFFLSSSHFKMGDELVQSVIKSGSHYISYWGTKLHALFMSIIMLFATLNIEEISKYVFNVDKGCKRFDSVMLLFAFVMSHLQLIFYAVLTYVLGKGKHKFAETFLQLARMHVALYLFAFSHGFAMFAANSHAFTYYVPFPFSVGIVSSAIAGSRPSFILKHEIKRSLKKYAIDIVIIVSWMAIQYWAAMRILAANAEG